MSEQQQAQSQPATAAGRRRTYSLIGPPYRFLVTDNESGMNIGYADKIGGPLVALIPEPAGLDVDVLARALDRVWAMGWLTMPHHETEDIAKTVAADYTRLMREASGSEGAGSPEGRQP